MSARDRGGENPQEALERARAELLTVRRERDALRADLDAAREEIDETNRGVLALYAELEERAELLREASEMKSRFLSSVSHELRTPLSAILSLSSILLDEATLGEDQHHQAQLIHDSAETLHEIVDDLLDLARIEAGRIDIVPRACSIDEILAGVRGMMRPTLGDRPIDLVVETAEHLDPIETDEKKVSQILRNLVANALDFTPEGEVRVRASEPDETHVDFEVSDTGIGIAPEDRARIFDEFVQVDSAIQRRRRGSGLGLSLSARLAEALGGALHCESRVGHGSIFTLRVPRRSPGVRPSPEETSDGC